jgi:hypothetical protein
MNELLKNKNNARDKQKKKEKRADRLNLCKLSPRIFCAVCLFVHCKRNALNHQQKVGMGHLFFFFPPGAKRRVLLFTLFMLIDYCQSIE